MNANHNLTVLFWCTGCMRQRERIFRFPFVPTHVNVFGMLCVPCEEYALTKPLPQADGASFDVDEGGDDSGPLVSV